MHFVVNSSLYADRKYNRPTIILCYDNWDDYSFKTTFNVVYSHDGRNDTIGLCKILCKNNINTFSEICREFEELDNNYCSLGQDLEYYENLLKLCPDNYMEILSGLNDAAIFSEIYDGFSNEDGFKISLLRFSSAVKALKEAKNILNNTVKLENNMSFDFKTKMPYSDTPSIVSFNFDKNDVFSYRINVIIGKNGTGKTHLLTDLANQLSGYTDEISDNDVFCGKRPPFDKVLSVTYSAFDPFKIPNNHKNSRKLFSYVYCGIKNEKGILSSKELKDNLIESFEKVKEKQRLHIWKKALSVLLENEHQDKIKMLEEENFENLNLSSGQNILIYTITDIISNIDNESIILFDEPEMHLHPNAVSNFVRVINTILSEYNSYAILSTHSPILLQEIPSKFIQVLSRIDNQLISRQPNIETFGSNISEIIFDVFNVTEIESNYKMTLDKLSKIYSFKEVEDIFENRLSLNALLYLKQCYER